MCAALILGQRIIVIIIIRRCEVNRKVLITGASRGIGKAIAEAFAAMGDELFLTCKQSEKQLASFAEHLRSEYGVKCSSFTKKHPSFTKK